MDTKISDVKHDNLGEVGEVVVTKDDTLFLKGKGGPGDVQARCEQLKQEIEETNSEYEKEKLNERLAKLSDGVAIIKVSILYFSCYYLIVLRIEPFDIVLSCTEILQVIKNTSNMLKRLMSFPETIFFCTTVYFRPSNGTKFLHIENCAHSCFAVQPISE